MKKLLRAGLVGALMLTVLPATRAEAPAAEAYTWGVRARLKEMDGDIDGAIADYDKAIAVYPTDPQPYNARGALKKEKGDLAGAIADYGKAIDLHPKNDAEIIYANRGGARHENGDLDGALADYNEALTLKPDYAVIYNNRALIRKTKGDLAGAMADFGKAIELKPDAADFFSNRGRARQEQGDFAGAAADFDQQVTLDPANPQPYYERGNFRRFRSDFEGALADYGKLAELRPKLWIGPFCQAVTRQAKGDLEAARKDYDQALANAGDDGFFITPYREIMLRQLHRGTPFGELARTVAAWKDSWSKNTGLYLIEALTEHDYFVRAGQGAAREIPVQRCAAFYFAGMTRLLAGDQAAARGFFEQCVALNLPDCDEFILARAEVTRLPKKT